jgi:hypothetical protein
MPIIEINGQRLSFDTAEQANGYLAELDASSTAAPAQAYLTAAEPRTAMGMVGSALESALLPPVGLSNAIKDLKTSWNGGDPQYQPVEHISPTAALFGYSQGAALNKVPEIAGLLDMVTGGKYGENLAKDRAKIAEYEGKNPGSYYAGNVAGQIVGAPGKLAKGAIGFLEPYVGKGLSAILANLGIGQANLPLEATSAERQGQAATDTAFGVAGQSLDSVLNVLSQRSQIKNALKSSQPPNIPYEEGVNASLLNARDELAGDAGTYVPLVPEQALEDPGFLNLGRSQTKAIEQNKKLNEVAAKLEGKAGIPNRPQSNLKTKLTTEELAPHIDEQQTTEAIGTKLLEAKKANDDVYQQRYTEITSDLAASSQDKIVPTSLNNAVAEVTNELAKGTKVTETATINFLNKANQEGLIGGTAPVTVFAGTDTPVPAGYFSPTILKMNPGLVEVKGGPAKVSLENLYKMRKELSDIEYTSEGNNNQPLLRKLKLAIDDEMKNYGKAVNVANPGLGNKVFKLNEDFKSDLSRFENKNVKTILNQLNPADPNNKDLIGATNTLYKAAKAGDLQTMRAVEKLVGPEQTMQLKQSMVQRALRGDNPDSYDVQGLSKRLADLPEEAKNYYFGSQRKNYENLAEIGKYVDAATDKFQARNNTEGIMSAYGAKRFVVNKLLSKFNNNPVIAEMLVRKGKITPALARFQATRLVEALFKMEAAETGVDLQKNSRISE